MTINRADFNEKRTFVSSRYEHYFLKTIKMIKKTCAYFNLIFLKLKEKML